MPTRISTNHYVSIVDENKSIIHLRPLKSGNNSIQQEFTQTLQTYQDQGNTLIKIIVELVKVNDPNKKYDRLYNIQFNIFSQQECEIFTNYQLGYHSPYTEDSVIDSLLALLGNSEQDIAVNTIPFEFLSYPVEKYLFGGANNQECDQKQFSRLHLDITHDQNMNSGGAFGAIYNVTNTIEQLHLIASSKVKDTVNLSIVKNSNGQNVIEETNVTRYLASDAEVEEFIQHVESGFNFDKKMSDELLVPATTQQESEASGYNFNQLVSDVSSNIDRLLHDLDQQGEIEQQTEKKNRMRMDPLVLGELDQQESIQQESIL